MCVVSLLMFNVTQQSHPHELSNGRARLERPSVEVDENNDGEILPSEWRHFWQQVGGIVSTR